MYVSVAMCTFNGERYLTEQLESIARQTRVPDEIVILDDRSEDGTVEVAKAVCQSSGLQCAIEINEVRLGVEANFARALSRTRGDVVFFCDQDDVWKPGRVERMLAPFSANPRVSLVYSDGYIAGPDLTPSGTTIFSHKSSKKGLVQGNSRDIGRFLKQGRNPGIKASAMAFTSWVRDWAGRLPVGIEHDSWMAFFGYALGEVVVVDEPLYFYRRHAQTSGKSSTNRIVGETMSNAESNTHDQIVRDRARLARCLYERMGQIQEEVTSRQPWNARFRDLYLDVGMAIRMLESRTRIFDSVGTSSRLYRALKALSAGGYSTFPGWKSKLRCLSKDVRTVDGKKRT